MGRPAQWRRMMLIIPPSAIVEFDKVAQWLKYPDPSFKLSRLLDDRAEGTGSWFLDGDEFTDFRQGKTKSVLLIGKGESSIFLAHVISSYASRQWEEHNDVR